MTEERISANDTEEDGDGYEEVEVEYAQVADHLSTLSQQEEFPAGVNGLLDPFEADEVSFDSSVWLLRVLAVQGWMRLPAEISQAEAENDPTGTAISLFAGLGEADPAACVETAGGTVIPTEMGATALVDRLDLAVRLMERFQELGEAMPLQAATQKWIELWEEEPSAPPTTAPIKAEAKVWPINEFSGKAVTQRLNLSPSYQRADVWPIKHSQQLIISILRGIPLPSVILLKPRAQGAKAVYEVVDGKQRLTAILRFIGKHPRALKRVQEMQSVLPEEIKLEEAFHSDYKKFRRLWRTHCHEALNATKEAEYYFPFRLPGSDAVPQEELRGKYYCEILEHALQIGDDEETVQHVFENVSNYKIPVIEYSNTEPRQIHEVFNLYNRQGKHLNAEEIRNALFHNLDLMRLLMVASGDNADIALLATYVPESDHQKVKEIGEALTEYRFGTARYRRTKLLSWLTSLILHPSLQEDGSLQIRSTAKQVNELLLSIEANKKHRLRDQDTLIKLVADLHRSTDAHSSMMSAWAPRFRDDKDGSKWQELQLVASLVAVFLAGTVHEDPVELLEERHDELYKYTATRLRPEKTQNRTQWGFIGEVALGILDVLGVPRGEVASALEASYGCTDCISTLEAASAQFQPRVD